MKIGITGTRSGMNDQQFADLNQYLIEVIQEYENSEFHHGDCVGVDVEAATIAKSMGYKVVCHPPQSDELRAFHASDEIRSPLTYFARNRNIVDETDLLLVVPYQNDWQPNGGTWYTAMYAKKKKLPYIIFYPNGIVEANDS